MMQDLIIGTAGHIDHGKTTLVRALTGIDTDRLQEEKARGITIDIGFAHLTLNGYRVGFIDVPGHEKFVKNMLAGIGGVQLLLLVVAADESVMPQTIEHLEICRLLEIPVAVIAMTRKDRADLELRHLVREEITELLQGTRYESAPIVEVNSLSGEGIQDLREVLLQQISKLENTSWRELSSKRIFRLAVDRVFSVKGFGTVVTGTPYAGSVTRDQTLQLYPGSRNVKVRGIEVFNERVKSAFVGQRTALNLTGVEMDDLHRGMVLSVPGLLETSFMFDAWLECLSSAPVPIRSGMPVRFHHGSAELMGRVFPLPNSVLEPGSSGPVQLRLDTELLAFPGDRFVLRRPSPVDTLAGGIILHNKPVKHRRKGVKTASSGLERLFKVLTPQVSEGVLVEYFVNEKGPRGIKRNELIARTGFLPEYLDSILNQLESVVIAPGDPPVLASLSALAEFSHRLADFLTQFHRRNPLAFGAPREELRKRFLPQSSSSYFQFLLQRFEEEDILSTRGAEVACAGRRITLNADQESIRAKILERMQFDPLRPPTLTELCEEIEHPPQEVSDVYYFMISEGDLVRVSEDLVLPSARLRQLEDDVRKEFPPGSQFSVTDFKDRFGLTRKYAIPILEFLDRNRVTQRSGDQRITLS